MDRPSDNITAEELFKGFFSRRKWVNLWYMPKRFYVLEFGYLYENNPHGDQVIWCLYSPEGLETIERFFATLSDFIQSVNHKILIIDNYEAAKTNLFLRMITISDGCIIGYYAQQRFNDPLENKTIDAAIGIAIGQGRDMVFDREAKLVVTVILGHALSVAGVQDNFTNFGAKLLDRAIRQIKETSSKGGGVREAAPNTPPEGLDHARRS